MWCIGDVYIAHSFIYYSYTWHTSPNTGSTFISISNEKSKTHTVRGCLHAALHSLYTEQFSYSIFVNSTVARVYCFCLRFRSSFLSVSIAITVRWFSVLFLLFDFLLCVRLLNISKSPRWNRISIVLISANKKKIRRFDFAAITKLDKKYDVLSKTQMWICVNQQLNQK